MPLDPQVAILFAQMSMEPASDITRLILHSIYQYIKERIQDPTLIEIYNDQQGPYVEIVRKRTHIIITVNDNIAKIESFTSLLDTQRSWAPRSNHQVDLQHPDSLQRIFEHIMSKRFK